MDSMQDISGEDLLALGLVKQPSPGDRLPLQPSYKIITEDKSVFRIYWGYCYDEKGAVVSFMQDAVPFRKYCLVSIDDKSRAVVLSGIRVMFQSESLHPTCKMITAEVCGIGSTQTVDAKEAYSFLNSLRPEWKEYIGQSILVDLAAVKAKNLEKLVMERVNKFFQGKKATSVFHLEPSADPSNESVDEYTEVPPPPTPPPPTTQHNYPPWSSTDEVACSDEFLTPPSREDRPCVFQFRIDGGTPSTGVKNKIKAHVLDWAEGFGHKSDTVFSVDSVPEGMEVSFGWRIGRLVGYTAEQRKGYINNTLTQLKKFIESGRPPRKDSKQVLEAVPGVHITGIRIAYPNR